MPAINQSHISEFGTSHTKTFIPFQMAFSTHHQTCVCSVFLSELHFVHSLVHVCACVCVCMCTHRVHDHVRAEAPRRTGAAAAAAAPRPLAEPREAAARLRTAGAADPPGTTGSAPPADALKTRDMCFFW